MHHLLHGDEISVTRSLHMFCKFYQNNIFNRLKLEDFGTTCPGHFKCDKTKLLFPLTIVSHVALCSCHLQYHVAKLQDGVKPTILWITNGSLQWIIVPYISHIIVHMIDRILYQITSGYTLPSMNTY